VTFWDYSAPFYDAFEKVNKRAYERMLETVRALVPAGASVLEAAAGTGSISLAVFEKAGKVLCTDLSGNMLAVARMKIKARGAANITVAERNIFSLKEGDSSFDAVIAGQVLHLIDEPEKAAAELRRVARRLVIMPVPLLKGLRGSARFAVQFLRLIGFAPKAEIDAAGYKKFIAEIGFRGCEFIDVQGVVPMAVAVWRKGRV
jgi:ubiquinone/menaquinone biosynthesis C-methylase UbiE